MSQSVPTRRSSDLKEPVTVLLIGRDQYKTTGPFTDESALRWNDTYPGIRILVDDKGLPLDTIHSTKGLEADTVIIHSLQAGYYGFPNAMEDDPLLRLIRPDKEAYLYAEERRLFYVALTRAKRKATNGRATCRDRVVQQV